MEKWEYHVDGFRCSDFTDLKNVQQMEIYLNSWGSQGWELVNSQPILWEENPSKANSPKFIMLLFKRRTLP